MCGIAGYIGLESFFPSKNNIKSCLKLMKLRGPDSQKTKEINIKKYKALLCASRLSIIDIGARSDQPFEDDEGIISFNGEIYNYIEIKKELLKKKIKFQTKSDTEVLLKYLNYYGPKNLEKIFGMWSFIYYSKKKKEFILSRDKFGEKPVFFDFDKNLKTFIFGSNVNYIKKLSKKNYKIDESKIYDYIRYGFRSVYSNDKTFFKGITVVKPGQVIQINKNLKIKKYFYIKYKKYYPDIKNYNYAKKLLKDKICNQIPMSLRSDVPIAVLLSGGIDSTIISYLAKKKFKKIKFYSYKQREKNYDESKNISLIKKKFKLNHEFIPKINPNKNYQTINNLIKEIGFPLLSTTNLAINKICNKIKKDGFKVLISGNGGDEMFSGYYAHHMSYLLSIKNNSLFQKEFKNWEKITKPHIRTNILKDFNLYKRKFKKDGYNFETDIYRKYFKILKKNYLKKNNRYIYSNDIFINHLNNDLFNETLPAQTHTIDNISMHNSIESRMPFLNNNFFNLRNRLSKNFLIKKGYAKFILRDIFKNKIPKKILFNPEKTGFFLPLEEAINFKSKFFFKTIFESKVLRKIIKMNVLKDKIFSKNLNQQDQKFIFLLYNAAIFLKINKI